MRNIFSLDNMGSRESFMKDLETRLSAGMKRAYWDMMEKDISNNDFRTTFAMVEEIRARICLLVVLVLLLLLVVVSCLLWVVLAGSC